MSQIAINPPAAVLGAANAIVSGRARRYEHLRFRGPLSIKSVVQGSACWATEAGEFVLEPRSALIVNQDEEYSITVDAVQPVETFCLFFARGFVEDAHRAATTGSAELLEKPEAPPIGFFQRLQYDPRFLGAIEEARRTRSEESFYSAAAQLVRLQCDVDARVARLPALRATTRMDLSHRLARATDYIHSNLSKPLRLADVASAGCLSPFHFHRLFASFHGETPHRYLTRLRLERARALLRGSSRAIAEVAMECGFESIGSFTSLFSRRFGISPARFRKIEEEPAVAAL